MDGFGVHTFRFVTDAGTSKLIKWHWKTKQGKASLVWEEAQVLAGKNADFHRQDLWDAIASGNGPEWELGVQIVEESDVLAFGFDLLDPTKIVFIVATGAETLFTNGSSSTFFPANRQLQILLDGYRWGKLVGALGSAVSVIKIAGITTYPRSVYN